MLDEYNENSEKLYMKAYNLSIINEPKKTPQRIQTYHFRDLPIQNATLRKYIISGLMRIMNILPIKKKGQSNLTTKYGIYGEVHNGLICLEVVLSMYYPLWKKINLYVNILNIFSP